MNKLRVWNVVNPPNRAVHFPVKSPEEAIEVINREAQRQLQYQNIFANAFGLEEFIDGEWSEWEHEELGCQIDEYERILEEESV